MRRLVIAAVVLTAACRKDSQPKTPEVQPPTPPDSASVVAHDDSMLRVSGIGGSGVITSRGDTLINLGETMMEADSARDYGMQHYSKNGIQYLRVEQMMSRRPDGKPVWAVRDRVRLPAESSPDNLVLEGLCSVDGKYDPFIIAVTGAPVDSVRFQATRAWRFDLAKQTLIEMPTAGVTCAHATGED